MVQILAQHYSLVIRQKDESQKGGGKKTKQAKFSEKRLFLTPWYALCSFLCRFAHFHLTGTLLFSKQLSYKKGFRNTQRWSLLLDKWGGVPWRSFKQIIFENCFNSCFDNPCQAEYFHWCKFARWSWRKFFYMVLVGSIYPNPGLKLFGGNLLCQSIQEWTKWSRELQCRTRF